MLHRMTVTGQRIISPLSDPINRLVVNSDPYDDEFDWHTAYSSPEFDTLEHPKPIYIYDELTEPDSDLITKDTYPELVGRWEPGHIRGRQ